MTDDALTPTYATEKRVRAVAEAVRELATFTDEELRGVDERCVRSFATQTKFNLAQAGVNREVGHRIRLLTYICLLNSLGVLVLAFLPVVTR